MNKICCTTYAAVNMKTNNFKVQHSYRYTYRHSRYIGIRTTTLDSTLFIN